MSFSNSALQSRLERKRAVKIARGIASPETPTSKTLAPVSGPMSPPQETRLKILPQIAEYRAKGWITEKEEAEYHQLLSTHTMEFGHTIDKMATQVQKYLARAKERNTTKERSESKEGIPASSRSLFRKPVKTSPGVELTLDKKISYRRKCLSNEKEAPSPSPRKEKLLKVQTMFDEEKKNGSSTATRSVRQKKSPHLSKPKTPMEKRREMREFLAKARARRQASPANRSAIALKVRETSLGTPDKQAHLQQVSASLVSANEKLDSQSHQRQASTSSDSENVDVENEQVVKNNFDKQKLQQQNGKTQTKWAALHKPLSSQQVLRESSKDVNRSQDQSICEPRQMGFIQNTESDEEIKELFVEIAFFARLGFVQPPSCLRCVHRESIENNTPDLACSRFVPWRKDANIAIHPHRLDGNIVLVKCHAARLLIQGKEVQQHRWDKMRRQLVSLQ